MKQSLVAVLPCNNLDEAEGYFVRLGFRRDGGPDDYRMMADDLGGLIHLHPAVEGWLISGQNPFGLYLYREDVDGVAAAFAGETLSKPDDMPWGMYEFAMNGPDETLVRVGWPTRLRPKISS